MKIVLTHLAGPAKGRVDEFSDRCVTVGSAPMNDLVLADLSVAAEHIRIFCQDERFRVAQSSVIPAETFVNGEPVRGEGPLDDGDVVELGRRGPKLRFNIALRAESAATTPVSGVSRRTKSLRLILHDAAVRSREEAISENRPRAPLFLRDVLEEVARSSSRRLKLAIAAVALVTVGAAGWALLEIGRWRATVETERARTLALVAEGEERERRLRLDLEAQKARLESETTRLGEAYAKLDEQSARLAETKRALGDADEEQRRRLLAEREESERERAALLEEVRALEARLDRAAGTFEALARRYEKAIFLVTTTVPGRGEVALATAFAIRADGVLGTNAHVAAAIDEVEESAGRPVPFYCVMNKQPERRYEVIRYAIHESYDTPFSPDVALFKVDTHGEPLPVVIPFAPDEDLRAIAEGMAIAQIGFPGEEADPRSPIATFKQGYIGRVTDFEKRSGDPAKAFLIQHSALTTKGTSGSPMVDARGRLIGVNNAGEGVRTILGATVIGGRAGNEFLYSATGINWGIRADLLKAMLADF